MPPYTWVSVRLAPAFGFSRHPRQSSLRLPTVFALGSLTLLLKGVFLLRKSSEGIGLSEQEISELSKPSKRKDLPSLPYEAAQIVQDFGAGALLLWPLLRYGKGLNESWDNAPTFLVFVTGAFLFCLGWLIRRLTSGTLLPSKLPLVPHV